MAFGDRSLVNNEAAPQISGAGKPGAPSLRAANADAGKEANLKRPHADSARPGEISVCAMIPTKNRPQELAATVRSLLRQSLVPDQLIIVDQSGGSESQQTLQREYEQAPQRVRQRVALCYIRDVTLRGLAAARNRAMELARADVWLFLDDDVCLEPAFLEELLKVYGDNPQASGVSGIISNYPAPSRAFRAWSWVFVRGPLRDDRQPVYWKADGLRNAAPVRVSRLGGGLMSFRRAAIQGMAFDADLEGVSDGEDVDFCSRLPSGSVLLIAPRARLEHRQSPTGRSADHWLGRHARASYFLYRKNWNRGVKNRICFAWLKAGYALVATLASLRRGSLQPWRTLLAAARTTARQRYSSSLLSEAVAPGDGKAGAGHCP